MIEDHFKNAEFCLFSFLFVFLIIITIFLFLFSQQEVYVIEARVAEGKLSRIALTFII